MKSLTIFIFLALIFVGTGYVILSARLQLVEARELLAEHYYDAKIIELLVHKGHQEDAVRRLRQQRLEVVQYAAIREVRHSSLPQCVDISLVESYGLENGEVNILNSYAVKSHENWLARIENRLYKRWPGGREAWPDWWAAEGTSPDSELNDVR